MCLAIPAQISDVSADEAFLATVDIMGVRRKVNLQLLADDPPVVGDWVLVHVGFAMSRISHEQAAEQLDMLRQLGEASAAHEEAAGYSLDDGLP
ncbi:MAG TPA: HypC/HybG/HupF family hydrogenase formation chaperone [Pirellulales bacterium]|nr:HypC/HybG/HupF family hydrogenase formation chaperone [Pirellulales bacterium]